MSAGLTALMRDALSGLVNSSAKYSSRLKPVMPSTPSSASSGRWRIAARQSGFSTSCATIDQRDEGEQPPDPGEADRVDASRERRRRTRSCPPRTGWRGSGRRRLSPSHGIAVARRRADWRHSHKRLARSTTAIRQLMHGRTADTPPRDHHHEHRRPHARSPASRRASSSGAPSPSWSCRSRCWPATSAIASTRPSRSARDYLEHVRRLEGRGAGLGRRRRHPRSGRAQADRHVHRRAVRRARSQPVRLLPRHGGVRLRRRHPRRRDGRAPVDRHEAALPLRHRRPEGALAARPGRRPQARRVRAHRAERRIRRLQPRDLGRAPVRRVVAAERREALDRQRRQGRAHGLRQQRPRPRRPHRREGHGGSQHRAALRHPRPARQPPAARALQERARARREPARRAGRRVPHRDEHPQQRPDVDGHRDLGRHEALPRAGSRAREHAQAVRPAPHRLRDGRGEAGLDGGADLRARVVAAT